MSKIWINGKLADQEAASLSVMDRGFLLGDGLFETLLVEKGEAIFLEQHLARLSSAAAEIGLTGVPTEEDVSKAVQELALLNNVQERGVLRLTLSRGEGQRGLLPPEAAKPLCLMTLAQTAPYGDAPITAMISTVKRNEGSPASQMKTLGYLDNILAKQEAAKADLQEAIMLNNAGQVSCATIGNIFWIEAAGKIHTPALEEGALPGIVRAEVLALCLEHDFEISEGGLTPEHIQNGFLFMTNSLMGLRVLSLPDQTIDEKCRATFETLRNAYFSVIEQYRSHAGA